MPTLHEIQRDIARSILLPRDGAALAHIAGDGFAAAERFNVYRNNVAITLIAALRLAYPAVDKLVGPDFFDRVARAFISQRPPRTACLSDYGGELPDFLAAFPAAAALAYLADVARLEWTVNVALNAPDSPTLRPDALVGLAASEHGRVRFAPHPAVRLLDIRYPADSIWRAVLDGNEAELGAIKLAPEPISLLVQHEADSVVMIRLERDEARWTSLLFAGATLAEITPEQDSARFVALLADHLAHGRFAGWTTLPSHRAAARPIEGVQGGV
jgi:hypothetical protein